MLVAFNTRFGHLAQFKTIADLIDDFLSEERKAGSFADMDDDIPF